MTDGRATSNRVRFDSPLEMEMNGRAVRVLRLVPSDDPDIEDEFVVEDDAGRQWHAFPCELHVVPNG